MKASVFRTIILACLMAFANFAFAADTDVAATLKGEWTGEWSVAQFSGKFVLVVASVEGAAIKGEGQWFGTATGDSKSPLKTAVVKDGELVAEQEDGAKFKLKLDGEKLKGSWQVGNYTGDLSAARNK